MAITFPFLRLPLEVRLGIWCLALPACTVNQVWKPSREEWQFVREIPSILQVCREARKALIRGLNEQDKSDLVYRRFEIEGPFYFCTGLDTLYLRRESESSSHSFDD